jgi:outer membrane protease
MNRLAKIVGAALACALGGAAFARGSLPDISGELEVSGGMLYGTAHEYVIVKPRELVELNEQGKLADPHLKDQQKLAELVDSGERDGADRPYSRLDWDEKAVPTVSVAGRARLFDVFASAGIQLAAPFPSGVMQDYDFISGTDKATDYSRHKAYLDSDFSAAFELGYTFALSERTPFRIPLRLTPLAGFRYRIRKWTASDGYGQYSFYNGDIWDGGYVWTGDEEKELFTGTVITYAQTLSSLSTGLEAEYQASRTVALKLRGSVYPYSWAHSLDTHFGRDLQFYDKMSGGIGGSAQFSALYRPFALPGSPAFTCSLSYEHIGRLTGRTASGYIGEEDYELGWTTTGFGSQTESSGLSASLGIAWRLGCAPPAARETAKAPVPPPGVSGGGRQPRPQEPAPPPRVPDADVPR